MVKKYILAMAACCFIFVLSACGAEQKAETEVRQQAVQTEQIQVGEMAPDIELTGLDGKILRLSELYGHGPVFINFWASWCPPCVQEMPDIQKAYEGHNGDIQFVAVDMDQKKEDGQAFWQKGKFTVPMYRSNIRDVTRAYQITGIPLSVLIDKGGKIVNMRLGSMSGEDVEKFLQPVSNR